MADHRIPTIIFAILLICGSFLAMLPVAQAISHAAPDVVVEEQSNQAPILNVSGMMAGYFTENRGQFDPTVTFMASTEFGKVIFYESKVQYSLELRDDTGIGCSQDIFLTFPGSIATIPKGAGLEPHRTNYLLGDQCNWLSGVPNYRSIVYQDLWPGIDLVYSFNEKGLKYEYRIDPFVDEGIIKVRADGAELWSEPSRLTFVTSHQRLFDGELMITEGSSSSHLEGRFITYGNEIAYEVEGRDRTKNLTIDPLVYSTYMGGSGNDYANSVAVDSSGNVYVTGYTGSTNFPTSVAYQASINGSNDAFVLKLSSDGGSLLYSTYIGGSANDVARAIAIDPSGNAYVTGYTGSTNFPTSNPIRPGNNGMEDAFVLKLSSSGGILIYSTYMGGSGNDIANGIALDSSNNAYVAGTTSSTDFPVLNSYQSNNRGLDEAFAFKLNSAGSALTYSTYIGGADEDYGNSIAVDSSGNAFVAGSTSSTNFPTSNAYQSSNHGFGDAFLLKLSAIGSTLLFSTYLGGAAEDVANAVIVGAQGNAYVAGSTYSTNFPTQAPYQASNAGNEDAFIAKMGASGSSLVYSTYIGGSGSDPAYGVALDSSGLASVVGRTSSTNFPTMYPHQGTKSGSLDAFELKLNLTGGSLVYSTYIGGTSSDVAYDIAIGPSGAAYVCGITSSTNFPTSIPYQSSNAGSTDAFILEVAQPCLPSAPTGFTATAGTGQVALAWQAPASNGGTTITKYRIYRGTSPGAETYLTFVGNVLAYTDTSVAHQAYYYKVAAENLVGQGPQSAEAGPATPTTAPDPPANLATTPGNTQLVLTWNPPANDGGQPITNYRIFRGTSPSGESLLLTVGNVLAYTNTGLTNGQTYYFVITAINSVGQSRISDEVSGTPATVPSSPQSLAASPAISLINLTWSAPSSNGGSVITGYKFYRGTAPGGETLLTTLGNVLSFTDSGLTNGQTYYYKVSAINSMGESARSIEASAMPGAAPSAPLSLTAISGSSQATLNWSSPSSNGGVAITAYKVYRGTTSGGETLLTMLGNVLTYTNTGLTNGQTYYYKVSAVNGVGEGPLSNEASATPMSTPSAPMVTSAIPDISQVVLVWTAPADNGGTTITGYKLYRGAASGSEALLTTLGNVLTYTDTGLTNGQVYYYKVSASNSLGEGALSNEVWATPGAVPSAPQGLVAIASDSRIDIAWSAPSSSGGSSIDGYRVYRGTVSNGESLLTTLGGAALSYGDTSLTNGQIYYYRVSALNVIGEGPLSIEASATPATLPTSPLSLTATGGNAQVSLTWSVPTNNGGSPIAGYKVYRGTSSGGETLLTTLGNVLTYTNTGLTNGQTYYYKVSAVNGVGEGPLSNEASATPSTVPAPPSNLVAVRGDAQVVLSWNAPASNGGSAITGYKVYRGESPGGESLLIEIGNVLTYTDTGLLNGQTYFFKVSAINIVGEGALSSEASATPAAVPFAPQSPTATSGNAQVVLGWSPPWSDGGSPITNYTVYRGTAQGGEVLLTTLGNVLTFTDVSLTNGQIYYYKVSAMNDVGEGALSTEVSATPATVPSAPQGLTATPGNVQVSLAWSTPLSNGGSAITGYKVYRGTSPGGESLLTTLGNVLSYVDTAVTNGQTYYYKVSAVNQKGDSPQSDGASAIPATTPSAPTGLTTARGNAQMTLAWSAPTSSGGNAITGYKVYRGTTSGGEVFLVLLGNTLSYVDTGLINGQIYFYKVSAVNGVGESALSNEASATPATVPTTPQILVATAGNSQVALTWSAPSSEGGSAVIGYKVYQGTSSGGEALLATLGNVLVYTSTGLANGQTYYFKVSASNAVGEGPLSIEASAIPATTPSAPMITSAVAGNAQIVLGWNAPSSDGGSAITGYKLYRGTTSGGESPIASIGALAYADTNLTNGQAYYYKVRAINVMGEGALSEEVSATPVTLPTAPNGLAASSGNGQIVLSWSVPANNGGSSVTAYKVYRGTSSGGETLLTTLGNVLTYTNTGLTNGQTYYYKVSAVNGVGEGPLSNEASATPSTVPSAPRGLQADAGDGFVGLNWTAPAYMGPGALTYHLFRDGALIWSGVGLEYADGGRTNGVTYSYKVAAQNSIGWGENSSLVQATPRAVDTVPTPPRGLAATPGVMLVDLNWAAPYYVGPGTLTYHLFRDGALIWSGTATSYSDSPLAKGGQLSYKVAAQNSIGWGANCTAVLATPVGAPDAPWGLVGTAGDSQASLTWNAVNYSGPGTLTYHLFRDGAEVWTGIATHSDDLGLSNGQSYAYKVAASNSIGWSANSSSISVVPRGPPSAPRGLQAIGGDGAVVLNWTSPSYAGPIPSTYHLFRDGVEVWSGGALSYVDASLSNGRTYLYNVAASNPYGWGPNSSIVGATPQGPPTAPCGFAASPGDGKVQLNWSTPSYIGPGTLAYHLLRDGLEVWSGIASSYSDSGLSNGQSYSYKVAASNSIGWSAFSSSIDATPQGPPGAPDGLVASPGNGFVELNWTAPTYSGPGVLTYHLYRDGTSIWSGQGLSCTDGPLVNGVTYRYKVRASNDLGQGANSSEVSATPVLADTVPSAPRDLVAVPAPGAVDLSWAEPSYTGPGMLTYHLFRESSLVWSGTDLSYHDAPLAKGVLYSYKVAASNSIGWGSNGSQATASALGPPDAPWGLTAAIASSQASLSWSAPNYSGPGDLIYNLFRDGILLWSGTATDCVDIGLTNGRTYVLQGSGLELHRLEPQLLEPERDPTRASERT